MVDVNRTPTLEQYGEDFRLNATDIRTVAIAMPKVIGTKGLIDTITQLYSAGHTLDAGVRVKAVNGDIFVSATGATLSGSGYKLSSGDEVFIEINQLGDIYVTGASAGRTACFIAS